VAHGLPLALLFGVGIPDPWDHVLEAIVIAAGTYAAA